jgi:hypothetical protein
MGVLSTSVGFTKIAGPANVVELQFRYPLLDDKLCMSKYYMHREVYYGDIHWHE